MSLQERTRREEHERLMAYQHRALEQVDAYASRAALEPEEHQTLREMLGGSEDMRVTDLDLPADR